MSMYTEVISEFTVYAIHHMREDYIPYYKELLTTMEREAFLLESHLACATNPEEALTMSGIKDKLESFYRKELKGVLFPLFMPFGKTTSFDSTTTREFLLSTKQFFIKRWKNNQYYCLPVSDYNPIGVVTIIPPEELGEDIKGFNNPTMAMVDFYIHLLEEVQETYNKEVK